MTGIIDADTHIAESGSMWQHIEKDMHHRRNYRIYVACEADEDIPYLAQFVGHDHLLIGSDYGHNDPEEEKTLVDTMGSRADLSSDFLQKIFTDNPRRFYGLS